MENTRKKSMTHIDVHQNIKEQLGRISELERKAIEADKVSKRKPSFCRGCSALKRPSERRQVKDI